MTLNATRAAGGAIWLAMVDRAERLHDKVVLAQARPTVASAKSVFALANDIAALARTAALLSSERRR